MPSYRPLRCPLHHRILRPYPPGFEVSRCRTYRPGRFDFHLVTDRRDGRARTSGTCDRPPAEPFSRDCHDRTGLLPTQGYVLHRRYELQQRIPDPEGFIEYMASLSGKEFEFCSCFISYSTKDQEFADRQGGKKLHEPAKNRPVQNFPEADLLHFTIQPRRPDLLDLVLTLFSFLRL